jgi:inner membrane protein
MFIAHLPVGYLASRVIYSTLKLPGIGVRRFVTCGICGSIAPDLDLFYFYLIDDRQHNHRSYWTHYPSVWICLILISLIFCYSKRWRARACLMVIFTFNGFIHTVLDSIAGDIYWFAPFVHGAYSLVTVPARYEPWWLNFILHWTFWVEMIIVMWSILAWRYHAVTVRLEAQLRK